MLEIQGYKDLYEQERLKVYNMDCMELLKQVPDKYFDLAIVDPPYGININISMGRRKGDKKSNYHKFRGNDTSIPNAEFFNELKRVSKNQVIWGGNYMIEHLTSSPCWLIWDKGFSQDITFAQVELAWTSFNSSSKKFDKHPSQQNRIHPTQKPVALYTWLLEKYAKPNFKIIDTHFGSGSHGISNHYFGSELIACELDTDYFKASIERIKKETRQLSFLQGGI